MEHWNPTIKRFLVPEMSSRYFLYRLPFYLNFIFVGYCTYWEFKFNLIFDPGAIDTTNRMETASILAVICWLLAFVLADSKGGKGKKRDTSGLIYLTVVFIWWVSTRVYIYLFTPVF